MGRRGIPKVLCLRSRLGLALPMYLVLDASAKNLGPPTCVFAQSSSSADFCLFAFISWHLSISRVIVGSSCCDATISSKRDACSRALNTGREFPWFVPVFSLVSNNIRSRSGSPSVGASGAGCRDNASANSLFFPAQCSTVEENSSSRKAHLASFDFSFFIQRRQVSAVLSVLRVKWLSSKYGRYRFTAQITARHSCSLQ